ncbi:MAG: insulinase family protein [Holosporales bacterium]|jgi:zinc protease|nr:insulinase family protein [Holosporales bacterium]
MKNKLLRILFLTLFGCAGFYLFKSWDIFREKTSFEVEKFQFSPTEVNVEEVKTSFKEPVWFVKTDTSMVCFTIKFKNEGNRSFYKTPGLLDVVLSTLIEGSGSRDGIEFKKILNEKATSISVTNDNDDILVTVSCLAKYFDVAVELLCDILSKAHLKKEKLEISKQGLCTSIRQSQFNTGAVAAQRMNNLLYPEGHPYRYQHDNTLKMVQTYTKKDADKCYAQIFDPNNACMTIVGNLDKTQIIETCKKIHESISQKKNDFKNVKQETKLRKSGVSVHVPLDNPQSTVLFSLPGVLKLSDERYAVRIANMILGMVGFNSRLWKALRDEDGSVYGVVSSTNDEDMQATISGSARTRPGNTKQVIDKIKKIIAVFFEKGITQEELDVIKTTAFSHDIAGSTDSVLAFVLNCRDGNIPRDQVSRAYYRYYDLSFEKVNAAVKKYFDPSKLIFVSCGKSVKETKK